MAVESSSGFVLQGIHGGSVEVSHRCPTVDGFVTMKRSADGGVDGWIYCEVSGERDLQSMVLEVKGGKNVTIADLRALHSVLEREEAASAGLIVMHPLGAIKERNFRKLIGEAVDLEIPNQMRPYPRMQMLTVEHIPAGERFHRIPIPSPLATARLGQAV